MTLWQCPTNFFPHTKTILYETLESHLRQLISACMGFYAKNAHLPSSHPPQTYADQVRAVQVQYEKLLGYSDELTGNPAVGGRDSIATETRELRSDWEHMKDNVMDSLALLQREYDDWVRRYGHTH